MPVFRFIGGIAVVLILCLPLPVPAWSASSQTGTGAPGKSAASPTLLYAASGHLWLRPVDGGVPRIIATPWPVKTGPDSIPGFVWSPDGRRVALDDQANRLAVVNLTTGHITVLIGTRCPNSCGGPAYSWSPNGRYLAIVQPRGNGERGVLRVWDSAVGRSRQLATGLAAYVAYPEWSHDSTRIAVPIGRFDTIKGVYPAMVAINVSSGHTVHLGKGTYLSWSPDDRLTGIIRPTMCGANTCDEGEIVEGSGGGTPIVLARNSSSLFDNPVWARQPSGYAFDGWILDRSGHPVRHLVNAHERVVSWKPDGSMLALEGYHPYEGTPDTLWLSTPTGNRTRIYTDGRNAGCGACSKDVYTVSWSGGTHFAFGSPTYPTPKNVTVYSRFFVEALHGGGQTRIATPPSDTATLLGFVHEGTVVVVRAGRSVYRYDVAGHRLTVIVSGLPMAYNAAILDPAAS